MSARCPRRLLRTRWRRLASCGPRFRSSRKGGAESRQPPFCVELDAIPPAKLRQLAEQVIDRHVDHQRLQVLRVAEEEERKGLERLAARGLTDLGSQNGEAS